uniref:Actin-associated protein FAM107A n=1 Tax=Cyprinus carpio TaxID=7962 RepID=A0A8C2DY25_CYPCA
MLTSWSFLSSQRISERLSYYYLIQLVTFAGLPHCCQGARESERAFLSAPPPSFPPWWSRSGHSSSRGEEKNSESQGNLWGLGLADRQQPQSVSMGASYGKKLYSTEACVSAVAFHAWQKAYNIKQQSVKNGKHLNGVASAYADIQWEQPHQPRTPDRDPFGYPHREMPPLASYAPQPDYVTEEDDLIKPKKLINPVKASKSHQELHRELLMNHKRGIGVENKPELQRVLEQRKREQMIKQRKQEEEARRKISPLEQELLKRHQKLEELEKEQERLEDSNCSAPEFIKVKENLRRTSFTSSGEKEV